MGLVSVTADMRLCDTALQHSSVDVGLPAGLKQASAVAHFRITSIDEARPAREAGEGVCGGTEVEVHGASIAVAKLAAGLEAPRSFAVRRGRTGYGAGEEFLAFLQWNDGIKSYVPGSYMVPVVDGRIVWRSSDDSVLRNGLRVGDALAAVRRIARRPVVAGARHTASACRAAWICRR